MRHWTLNGAWLSAMALAVVCTVILAPDCASACSCAVPANTPPQEVVRQELSRSEAVFAGEVVDIDRPWPITSSIAPMKVSFRVSEAWKGVERETVDVQTAVSDASCGYPFDEGENYLVFASGAKTRNAGGLEVALCGSTTPVSEAKAALAALGPGAASAVSPPVEGRLPDTSGGRSGVSGPARTFLLASGATLGLAVVSVRFARGRWPQR